MGAEQTKCCGKVATHQLIVQLPKFHVGDDIKDLSGKNRWVRYNNQNNTTYMTYACDKCFSKLKTNLDYSNTRYCHTMDKTGFLKYDQV